MSVSSRSQKSSSTSIWVSSLFADIALSTSLGKRPCRVSAGASSEGTLIVLVRLSIPIARPCRSLGIFNLQPMLPPVCLTAAPVCPPDLFGRIAGWAGCGGSMLSVQLCVAAKHCWRVLHELPIVPSSWLAHQLVEHSGTACGVRQAVFRRRPYDIVFALKASLHEAVLDRSFYWNPKACSIGPCSRCLAVLLLDLQILHVCSRFSNDSI